MVDIGEDRVFGLNQFRHLLGARHILKCDCPQLDSTQTELAIRLLQLDELLQASASGLPAIKNQHNSLTARIAQANSLPVFSLERQVRRCSR